MSNLVQDANPQVNASKKVKDLPISSPSRNILNENPFMLECPQPGQEKLKR